MKQNQKIDVSIEAYSVNVCVTEFTKVLLLLPLFYGRFGSF